MLGLNSRPCAGLSRFLVCRTILLTLNQYLIHCFFYSLEVPVKETIRSLAEKGQCASASSAEAAENVWCCVWGCAVVDHWFPERTEGITGLHFINWLSPLFHRGKALPPCLGLLEFTLPSALSRHFLSHSSLHIFRESPQHVASTRPSGHCAWSEHSWTAEERKFPHAKWNLRSWG